MAPMKQLAPLRLVTLLGLLLQSSTGSSLASPRRSLRHARSGAHFHRNLTSGALDFHAQEGPAMIAPEAGVPPQMSAMFAEADDVARFLEKRRGVELVPEGAKLEVDLTAAEQRELESVFSDGDKPDIFKNCVLVRDFATPLRVGSALVARKPFKVPAPRSSANLVQSGLQQRKLRVGSNDEEEETEDKDDQDNSDEDTEDTNEKDDEDDATDDEDDNDDDEPDVAPPGDVLVAKGGVIDRDEAPEGQEDSALLKVDMVAYLESVAGEVSVVPKGIVAKWSSKKKVPVAGYLCTGDAGNVLYTLPTPCLASSLDDDGVPRTPPHPRRRQGQSDEGGAAAHEEENFAVYIGNAKLHFSSRRKAEHFCHKLTKEIAEDPGDNEWDPDKLKGLTVEKDMKVSTFVQLTRKDPPEAWTTGTKKVLVVVMDWMSGDSSKAPLTKQTKTPSHYRERIFPRVKDAFSKMSYGTFGITFDVVPEVIRYTKPRSRYAANGWPFPGLYNGATESLAGHATYGNQYDIRNYDLVYTISPQQAPVGTKGVAWVGAKGAMCNGCEAISENFQVMVAVHELGHNLGLSHAGSTSLEYGNPFDWMGNYPDVRGLSYGMGYKLKLHWLPRSSIPRVDDSSLSGLNDRYIVLPFDQNAPGTGQIMGIQLSLKKNPRDIFIAYRKTTGKEAGVYVVLQDKNRPDSELIDMGCHTPSQKDARLQPGWTFIDPSSQVVVKVEKVTAEAATIHVYTAPGSGDQAAIRARDTFSDGTYKCPRTCTDSDLLVANFNGCSSLAGKGYCASGAITMGGKKYSVKKDLCPEACSECSSVMTGSTMVGSGGGGCGDRNVKINGMSCPVIAAKGHCEASTNIGHVGRDLCPKSCGNCPPKPSFSSSTSAGSYTDPSPARTHGGVGGAIAPSPPPSPPPPPPPPSPTPPETEPEDRTTEDGSPGEDTADGCSDDSSWQDEDGHSCAVYREYISRGKLSQRQACSYGSGQAAKFCSRTCGTCSQGSAHAAPCIDDSTWRDKDGDSCAVYRDYIKNGQLTRTTACSYGGGDASRNCLKTCHACPEAVSDSACADRQCVREWQRETGQCYACADWPSRCNEAAFQRDCPQTCGLCKDDEGPQKSEKPAEEPKKQAGTACEDHECVDSWLESTGKCMQCEDFAADYCGNDASFMESCPKSCKLCSEDAVVDECADEFKASSCQEYKAFGWCSEAELSQHCKATCGLCGAARGGTPEEEGEEEDSEESDDKGRGTSAALESDMGEPKLDTERGQDSGIDEDKSRPPAKSSASARGCGLFSIALVLISQVVGPRLG